MFRFLKPLYSSKAQKIIEMEREILKLKFNEVQAKLEASQAKLEASQSKLEASQSKLEAYQSKLETAQSKLETQRLKLDRLQGLEEQLLLRGFLEQIEKKLKEKMEVNPKASRSIFWKSIPLHHELMRTMNNCGVEDPETVAKTLYFNLSKTVHSFVPNNHNEVFIPPTIIGKEKFFILKLLEFAKRNEMELEGGPKALLCGIQAVIKGFDEFWNDIEIEEEEVDEEEDDKSYREKKEK
ncbi:hypothetical protein ROZALSC1DRAFT_22739 [Rozella allomycis CSF55]|uniref:Uncharacterized protein n=1 Tax=Rozella allomycis (strain CSF55) TaxID=988480 RepID=A0A4V1IZR2_ROZAC|nr:hypothetical protein ROZALSC1DRAFT_22739 [Rozella allomycis CSF55]